MSATVWRAIASGSIEAEVVTSPKIMTKPVAAEVSHATRALGSCDRMASSTASEIWSHTLSGCPSVTDSDVKYSCGDCMKVVVIKSPRALNPLSDNSRYYSDVDNAPHLREGSR